MNKSPEFDFFGAFFAIQKNILMPVNQIQSTFESLDLPTQLEGFVPEDKIGSIQASYSFEAEKLYDEPHAFSDGINPIDLKIYSTSFWNKNIAQFEGEKYLIKLIRARPLLMGEEKVDNLYVYTCIVVILRIAFIPF